MRVLLHCTVSSSPTASKGPLRALLPVTCSILIQASFRREIPILHMGSVPWDGQSIPNLPLGFCFLFHWSLISLWILHFCCNPSWTFFKCSCGLMDKIDRLRARLKQGSWFPLHRCGSESPGISAFPLWWGYPTDSAPEDQFPWILKFNFCSELSGVKWMNF